MWRKGYGATFFYRTRLMSIPILIGSLWYSNVNMYYYNLNEAGIADYAKKKGKFDRDMNILKKFMTSRQDYIVESSKEVDSSTNI